MVVSLLCGAAPKSGEVHFGFFIIPQGEEWSVQQPDGVASAVEGPKVMRVWGDKLTRRQRMVAGDKQYLHVQMIDGKSWVVPGPAAMWHDPMQHKQITVHEATTLSSSEVLVVYREEHTKGSEQKAVRRELVSGPCLYKPQQASEWTHSFSWHGHDPSGGDTIARKRPHGLKFQKLQIVPTSTYFDVENVRTADDALLTVRLMIFFRIAEVETMLDATNDPIAEIINSVSSDVIGFCSARSFEQFKEGAEQLNNLGVYQQLTERMSHLGVEISKVVFRGYLSAPRLQKMHDDAIERRTRLVLERESEIQEQKLMDERLQKDEEREGIKRKMECAHKEHEATMRRAAFEAKQREEKEVAELKAAIEEQRAAAELANLARMQEGLGLRGEQMASLLVARAHGAPAKLIQVTGDCKSMLQLSE